MTTKRTTRRPRRSWGKIRRLPSGRWQASYSAPDLTRAVAPTTFTARMDAEYWLAEERRLIERGDWTSPALRSQQSIARGRTFGSYADMWVAQRALKPRTVALYRSLLRGPLAKLQTMPLAAITASTVRAWHAGLPDTPTRNAHAYQLLHSVLNTAVTDGLITANPAAVRGAMSARTKREPVILTPIEVAKLAANIRPSELRAFILIAAWCGLRFGELVELRRKDIGEGCKVIHVARGAAHARGKCYVDTPKSGRTRKVPVPKLLRADIAEHLAGVPSDPDSLLFPAPSGRCHLSDTSVRKAFHDALGRADVNLHDLRHFAGTQAARVGNLRETMDYLGHSTVGASLTCAFASRPDV